MSFLSKICITADTMKEWEETWSKPLLHCHWVDVISYLICLEVPAEIRRKSNNFEVKSGDVDAVKALLTKLAKKYK